MFLPVGSGSGMLPGGGSFVSLVSLDGCGEGQRGGEMDTDTATDLTVVIQTPRSAERLRANPLGIYVNAISWSREMGQ